MDRLQRARVWAVYIYLIVSVFVHFVNPPEIKPLTLVTVAVMHVDASARMAELQP